MQDLKVGFISGFAIIQNMEFSNMVFNFIISVLTIIYLLVKIISIKNGNNKEN